MNTTATTKPTRKPKLTCEPDAPARLVGNKIVNKACPELNAAKERAQREFAEQQARQESEAALRACREQTGMSTDECIADAKAGNAS
jgi:methylphosphotriester-DNA--protein-cysteine methyltransferase